LIYLKQASNKHNGKEGTNVDAQTQEPREGGYGELDIYPLKMVVDDRKAALDEGFEHALVKEGAMHRWAR
jgi:hypothetical protein